MERSIEVRHVSLEINAGFEHVTRALEQSLGRFDVVLLKELETDPQLVEKRLEEAAGEEGLMLFDIQDHGKLLNLFSAPKRPGSMFLGIRSIAVQMTRHDIRAGLYAPLRLLVYEAGDQSTRIEFDQPSSLFGQFHNQEVLVVAQSLDVKLASLIKKAEFLATKSRTGEG